MQFPGPWQPKPRDIRFLFYLLLVAGVAAWKYVPHRWRPAFTLKAGRHVLYSTATRPQTDKTAEAVRLLYTAYTNRLWALEAVREPHGALKLKLYKDRNEMRSVHPSMGWAEAFYSSPYCHAYYSHQEINPYHWMLHESVHQMNHEVAHLHLEKWLEEGLAEYFSTSRLQPGRLAVGQIDPNTYPVWWMELIATAPTVDENLQNKSVISLRTIIENRGGPSMSAHFNLYYLHWWTLTHFVFEDECYRTNAVKLVAQGGGLKAFEKTIGPVEKVQPAWHEYVRHIKAALEETGRGNLKRGKTRSADPPTKK